MFALAYASFRGEDKKNCKVQLNKSLYQRFVCIQRALRRDLEAKHKKK